jgi:hypothetical protein
MASKDKMQWNNFWLGEISDSHGGEYEESSGLLRPVSQIG